MQLWLGGYCFLFSCGIVHETKPTPEVRFFPENGISSHSKFCETSYTWLQTCFFCAHLTIEHFCSHFRKGRDPTNRELTVDSVLSHETQCQELPDCEQNSGVKGPIFVHQLQGNEQFGFANKCSRSPSGLSVMSRHCRKSNGSGFAAGCCCIFNWTKKSTDLFKFELADARHQRFLFVLGFWLISQKEKNDVNSRVVLGLTAVFFNSLTTSCLRSGRKRLCSNYTEALESQQCIHVFLLLNHPGKRWRQSSTCCRNKAIWVKKQKQ